MNGVFPWEAFYLVCFALGLSFTVLSCLGMFSHLHFGHVHFHAAHAQGSGHGVSPINGFTIAGFLCWFGGCGYLLHRFAGLLTPIVLGASSVAGLAGGAVLFWFLVKVLLPHERELTAADTDIVGVLAKVTATVHERGTGEIQYSQNGVRRFAVARSEDGQAVPRETEVVVMRYEQGIAWVRRWDELQGDRG
ncbi:hypothetical protein [Silvibacterium dinghuense]|uniref:Membrane protein NfeD2 N-terminal transmembrane domain-containing protein n=1 Tax=Silvibacterium dinghuense TaxID=1560006 RepID=A0A4Q1SHX8_9BACT|nr:hypothetical protein [Silvibacterium dinghuense]RXS97184.1 hypothetical protein ESZ00_04520 [Silvibacterium dinghuense]GGG96907.1 hypothetical protein GCM10011586_10180 [Silvibacterium dinghuense]